MSFAPFSLSLTPFRSFACLFFSYVRDCKGAGFEIEQVDDIQYMAASHLRGNAIKYLLTLFAVLFFFCVFVFLIVCCVCCSHLKDEKHPGKIAGADNETRLNNNPPHRTSNTTNKPDQSQATVATSRELAAGEESWRAQEGAV